MTVTKFRGLELKSMEHITKLVNTLDIDDLLPRLKPYEIVNLLTGLTNFMQTMKAMNEEHREKLKEKRELKERETKISNSKKNSGSGIIQYTEKAS